MPTYEYECEACGNKFEKFQSMSAAPVKKCPECGKNKVKRLIGTGAGLIFKGSGFYITNYRENSYPEQAKSESGKSEPEKTETGATSTDKPGKTKNPAAETKTESSSKPAASESKPAAKSKSD